MTAFVATDIPSNIDTLEKLQVWLGYALARCNPTIKMLESPQDDPVRVCEVVTIRDDLGVYRAVVRVAVPLADNYAEATTKIWESALKIDDVPLPSAFKSN